VLEKESGPGGLGPLGDVRILEIGQQVAAPLACSLLGDFGAEVIKVEPPAKGDSLRVMGPQDSGVGLWWSVGARNKKSITVNLKHPKGVALIRSLLPVCDILVENFRPGVMERLGLSWDEVRSINPTLSMLRISGFGQTGPYRERGVFGKIAEAFSGATQLTGFRDQLPLHPGYSLGDAVCGVAGALGIMLALRHQDATGEGQLIDLAVYEPLFKIIEWQIPLLVGGGINATRNGLAFPFAGGFLTSICEAADGKYVVYSAANEATIRRLHAVARDHGEVAAAEPSTEEIVEAIERWIRNTPSTDVIDVCENAQVPAGLVCSPADLVDNEQIVARGNIVTVPDTDGRQVAMPNVIPALSATPGRVRWAGPRLGEHTDEVLATLLGLSKPDIEMLRSDGAI
jgi:crotonobetainyl-CoA:carnitine CoA-transferase CaiB-like acyl-CoA transferase